MPTDSEKYALLTTAQKAALNNPAPTVTNSGAGISDAEVDRLGAAGYREGDNVPGRGVLLPDGTFSKAVVTSEAARKQVTEDTNQLAQIQLAAEKLRQDALKYKAEQDAASAKKTTPSSSAVDQAITDASGAPTPTKSQAVIDAESQIASLQTQIDSLQQRSDERTSSIISAIRSEYDSLIRQQEQTNKAYEGGVTTEGIVSGRARYAPTIQAGIIAGTISSGLGKIADLQAKKERLVMEAENARDEKNLKLLSEKMQAYRTTIKEEREAAQQAYENTLKASREARERAKEERDIISDEISYIEKMAPSIYSAVEGMTEEAANAYIQQAARDLGIDPNILSGQVAKMQADYGKAEKQSVLDLGEKYPDAGINSNDTFETATDKVRKSSNYQTDVLKAEADLRNTQLIINNRAQDASLNWSDPALALYTQATGVIPSSPSQAKGIIGYADSILSGKEIVDDNFTGELKENQVKASDAQKLITDAFAKIHTSATQKVSEAEMWQRISEPSFQALTDEEKATEILQNNLDPEDFIGFNPFGY